MRVIIESDDRLPATLAATESSRSEAIDAGPPAASLLQAIGSATAQAEAAIERDGTDAGGPPPALLRAVQGGASVSGDSDGGAAPN